MLTLTLNPLLPSIVFDNKICVFILILSALSFLRLIHGLFYEEVMSIRLCGKPPSFKTDLISINDRMKSEGILLSIYLNLTNCI